MKKRTKILVLTGAGISAESGLKTFRDADGLWENYKIEDVATPEAWQRHPELVLRFYNQRRQDCLAAQPNAAHLGLASMERHFDIRIVTQNIDDLHERAGSSHVMHLHGQLSKMRSELNDTELLPYVQDIQLGDKALDGGQYRPHVVWFGEAVPNIELAEDYVHHWAQVIVLIGSSLSVYPAAGLLQYAPAQLPKYLLDPHLPNIGQLQNVTVIQQPASTGIVQLIAHLHKNYL